MRNVVLIGAGRSSTSLIKYFLENAQKENWRLIIADYSLEQANSKLNNHPAGEAIRFNIEDESERTTLISKADIVISLLPATMHYPVAVECVRQKKNLVTASYVSPEMQELNDGAIAAGIILLNECGLDPGIDHMSAMEAIDRIKSEGGELTAFRSYTGGLVAPESDNNPWGYKFSWNPRNVILAGQGTARFLENGRYKYIPYNRLFKEIKKIGIDSFGVFDGYANRDSLSYRKVYGIDDIKTIIRGTLRKEGYCSAWNVFVQLGITDDSYKMDDSKNLSYKNFVEAFIPAACKGDNIYERLADFMGTTPNSREIEMVKWTGILDDEPVLVANASPAQILQHLLEEKWKLQSGDKDMIVMQHQFEYTKQTKKMLLTSSLVVVGDDEINTAMAKTVGLPVAIAARLIINGKVDSQGVRIPVVKEIYEPVLRELKDHRISFAESESVLV